MIPAVRLMAKYLREFFFYSLLTTQLQNGISCMRSEDDFACEV